MLWKIAAQFRSKNSGSAFISPIIRIQSQLNFGFCFSDLRYAALCKQIINDMNMYGMCVVDDFLGGKYGFDILREGKGWTGFQI